MKLTSRFAMYALVELGFVASLQFVEQLGRFFLCGLYLGVQFRFAFTAALCHPRRHCRHARISLRSADWIWTDQRESRDGVLFDQ